jgi:putative glycosyltransferase (TIGR04372 family)
LIFASETPRRKISFNAFAGSIGIEAIFPRILVAYLPLLRSANIDPVIVFSRPAVSKPLNDLIKRKLDALGVDWIDISGSRLKSKLFLQKFKLKGVRFLDACGPFRFDGKNRRYIEYLSYFSNATCAELNFDTFDCDAFATPCNLEFSGQEAELGAAAVADMGVSGEFATIHSRDDLYHGTTEQQRNIPLSSFRSACKGLVDSGVTPIRMGIGQPSLEPCTPISGLVNYSEEKQSQFLDSWLIANAKFHLGSNSGLFYVAYWFDTPVAIVNYACFLESTPFRACDLYLPQKIWSVEKKRLLTFREIADNDIGLFRWSQQRFHECGLEPIMSSDEEVSDLAIEMNQRIDGTFEETTEDINLQARFRSLFKPAHAPYYSPAKVGQSFLWGNLDLLE